MPLNSLNNDCACLVFNPCLCAAVLNHSTIRDCRPGTLKP